MADWLLVLVGLVLLFFGAEALVRGAATMALRLGLSSLVVGLTVVAFGTSAPEMVVSLQAAISGQGDIAVGNVVGSNIFNIGVILGLTALICPIPVHRQITRLDGPIALGVALLLPVCFSGGQLGRIEGAALVLALLLYTWMNVVLARREGPSASTDVEVPAVKGHFLLDVALVVVGLVLLVAGSNFLVDGAVSLARRFGVSEAVIGLTIVAAGTSLPELATSLVAAWRKQPDMAVGNVVGSNIFNLLGNLGLASLVAPLSAPGISGLDLAVMIFFSVLILPLLYTGRVLHRLEGALLLILYAGYILILWPK